ncbi:kinase-like protein [Lichtheimia hyalospora FSU 10163]|nr:kinase-like protein [Lichtheimia hyalospora FSU 10163]
MYSDKTNMSINWTHRSSSTAYTSVLSTSNGFSKSPTSRTRRSSRTSTTCTTPTTPCPFAAARPTSSSLKKQRHPHKLIDDEHPWRAPGIACEIPDIIKACHEKFLATQDKLKATLSRSNKISETRKDSNTSSPKRRWITVIRSPDIFPLPPLEKVEKPHAVFVGKVRKVLPHNKFMEINPKDIYIGRERIGSGANGAVISANSRRTGRTGHVAIKRCYIEDHDTHHHTYILRELRIMGCMSHPNLVSLTEACMWGDYLWMAMELMTCSVFGLLYNMSVGLPESYAVRVAHECLEGLVYLHSQHYMHRDVKCENILLNHKGQVKLADFGLATPTTKNNSARLGTAKWMAPEVVSETPYTESVDVWSMAITMIEMMDRVPPLYYLDGNREIFAEILYGQQPHFNFAMPSKVMVELISWMLDPDADKRPGAKSALMHLKQRIMAGRLQCANATDLGSLVRQVFLSQRPKQHP